MPFPLSAEQVRQVKDTMATVNDFPKPGIIFKDLSPLLYDGKLMKTVIQALADKCAELKPDCLALLESRGFLFGPAVGILLGIGSVMVRKPGKLPGKLFTVEYTLEYGSGSLTMQDSIMPPGSRVIVLDDLLATGGSALAAIQLVEKAGSTVVGAGFVSELSALNGRDKLPKTVDVFSLVQFDADMK